MDIKYDQIREALGIPQEASHEAALNIASLHAATRQPFLDVKIPDQLKGDAFVAAWNQWVRYRKERKLQAYKPMGLKAQFTKLATMGAAKAIQAIEFSISQNYQGIYEDRTRNSAGTTRSSQVIGTQDRYRVGPGVHGDVG